MTPDQIKSEAKRIADVVLKEAGSGGLGCYMPYSQDRIVAALSTELKSYARMVMEAGRGQNERD